MIAAKDAQITAQYHHSDRRDIYNFRALRSERHLHFAFQKMEWQ